MLLAPRDEGVLVVGCRFYYDAVVLVFATEADAILGKIPPAVGGLCTPLAPA